jgi:hypothetical protein
MHVYLIRLRNTNYFKVGVSTDIARRIVDLQSGLPWSIDLISEYEQRRALVVEQAIHKALAVRHAQGEWFECQLDHIEGVFHAFNAMAQIDDEMMRLAPEDSVGDPRRERGRTADVLPLLAALRRAGMRREDARALLLDHGIGFSNTAWSAIKADDRPRPDMSDDSQVAA